MFQTLAKVVDGWKKHETEKVAIINQLKVERENAEQSQQRQQEVTCLSADLVKGYISIYSGTVLIWSPTGRENLATIRSSVYNKWTKT